MSRSLLITRRPRSADAGKVLCASSCFEGRPERRRRCYQATMRRKLGLLAVDGGADDQALAEDLLQARRSLRRLPGLVLAPGARVLDREPERWQR